MFQIFRKEINWGGRKLVLETGKIARQADGAVGEREQVVPVPADLGVRGADESAGGAGDAGQLGPAREQGAL